MDGVVKCIACKEERYLEHYLSYNLIRCRICGHAWQMDAVSRAYGRTHLKRYYPSIAPQTQIILAYRALITLRYADKDTQILDWGSGNGRFVRYLRAITRSEHVYGLSPEMTDKSLQAPDSFKPEIITAFDVLEHLEDPTILFEIFNPNAVILTLPITPHDFVSEKQFASWTHYKPDEHLQYFSEASFEKFVENQGYDIIETSDAERAIRKDVLTFVLRRKSK